MNQVTFFEGTGRRKTAIARVRLLQGEGEVVVNGRSLEDHFGNAVDLQEILMPFRVTGTEGKFNAMIKVHGGGHHGQAGAIRHGIARAILQSGIPEQRTPGFWNNVGICCGSAGVAEFFLNLHRSQPKREYLEFARRLAPQYAVPVHDFYLNDMGRTWIYSVAKRQLAKSDIDVVTLGWGESFTL